MTTTARNRHHLRSAPIAVLGPALVGVLVGVLVVVLVVGLPLLTVRVLGEKSVPVIALLCAAEFAAAARWAVLLVRSR